MTNKFIELTLSGSGERFLISIEKIVAVTPGEDCTCINVAPQGGKGVLGYSVKEGYEQIKCMLNGVFEGVE